MSRQLKRALSFNPSADSASNNQTPRAPKRRTLDASPKTTRDIDTSLSAGHRATSEPCEEPEVVVAEYDLRRRLQEVELASLFSHRQSQTSLQASVKSLSSKFKKIKEVAVKMEGEKQILGEEFKRTQEEISERILQARSENKGDNLRQDEMTFFARCEQALSQINQESHHPWNDVESLKQLFKNGELHEGLFDGFDFTFDRNNDNLEKYLNSLKVGSRNHTFASNMASVWTRANSKKVEIPSTLNATATATLSGTAKVYFEEQLQHVHQFVTNTYIRSIIETTVAGVVPIIMVLEANAVAEHEQNLKLVKVKLKLKKLDEELEQIIQEVLENDENLESSILQLVILSKIN